jgi:hypothetical protein
MKLVFAGILAQNDSYICYGVKILCKSHFLSNFVLLVQFHKISKLSCFEAISLK